MAQYTGSPYHPRANGRVTFDQRSHQRARHASPSLPTEEVAHGHRSYFPPLMPAADHSVFDYSASRTRTKSYTGPPMPAAGHSVVYVVPSPAAYGHRSYSPPPMPAADHSVFDYSAERGRTKSHAGPPMPATGHSAFYVAPSPATYGHRSYSPPLIPAADHSVFDYSAERGRTKSHAGPPIPAAGHSAFYVTPSPATYGHRSYSPPLMPAAGHSVFDHAPNPAAYGHRSYYPPLMPAADHSVLYHVPNPAAYWHQSYQTPMPVAGHSVSDTDIISPVPDHLPAIWNKVKDGPKDDHRIDVLGANETTRPAGF
jgi:hypothetical protein